MKIGIVLIGVSYNDGSHGRYRYFMDSYPSFSKFITQPLIEQGHDVEIYLYTYDSVKTKENEMAIIKNEINGAWNASWKVYKKLAIFPLLSSPSKEFYPIYFIKVHSYLYLKWYTTA
jgi:hypothetical protein